MDTRVRMIDIEAIKANAALVVKACQGLVDFEFGYNERSVAWLEGYIERLRVSGTFEENPDHFMSVFGCYLGEAIIAAHGGRWNEDHTYPLHIMLEGNIQAFPLAKVRKQVANGLDSGDSILGFFRTIPALSKLTRDRSS
jgi:hypothetical protein